MSEKAPHIPYSLPRLSSEEMRRTAGRHVCAPVCQAQRSHVSAPDPIPLDVLERAIQIAGTAPSGAHKQPWSFCIVTDPELRARIRVAVEEEELRSYSERMSDRWLQDLAPLATDHIKPFIEEAPALIVVFRRVYEPEPETGGRHPNYYVQESCGIAVGLLLAALHEAGIAALTHTPSPMNFLGSLSGPPGERARFPEHSRRMAGKWDHCA